MKTHYIIGRRWFRKTYGQTYCSVTVVIDYGLPTEKTLEHGKTYGSGSHYEQCAVKILHEYGCTYPLSRWCSEKGVIFRNSVHDVKRERDL